MNLKRHALESVRGDKDSHTTRERRGNRDQRKRDASVLTARDVLVQVIHGHHAEDEFPGCVVGYAEVSETLAFV